ncbi:hypothetical protein Tco_1259693 [Tanacetum coccineum]
MLLFCCYLILGVLQPALPSRKRYRGTSELIEDTEEEEDESSELDDEREGSEDEGPGSGDKSRDMEREEEVVPEGQQQAAPVVDIAVGEPLGLGYGALRRQELALGEGEPTLITWTDHEDGKVYTDIHAYTPPVAPAQTPPSPEWSSGSMPISPLSPAVPTPMASPAISSPLASPATVEAESFMAIHGSQGEVYELRRQLAEERRERLELTERVTRMEKRQESRVEK